MNLGSLKVNGSIFAVFLTDVLLQVLVIVVFPAH